MGDLGSLHGEGVFDGVMGQSVILTFSWFL